MEKNEIQEDYKKNIDQLNNSVVDSVSNSIMVTDQYKKRKLSEAVTLPSIIESFKTYMNQYNSQSFQRVESLLYVLGDTISNDDCVIRQVKNWIQNQEKIDTIKDIIETVKTHGFCVSLKYKEPIPEIDSFKYYMNINLYSSDRYDFSNPEFRNYSSDQPTWVKLIMPNIADCDDDEDKIKGDIDPSESYEKNNINYGDWDDVVRWDSRYACCFYFLKKKCLCKLYTTPNIQTLNDEGNVNEWTLYPQTKKLNPNIKNNSQCHCECNPKEDKIINNKTGEQLSVTEWLNNPKFIINNIKDNIEDNTIV